MGEWAQGLETLRRANFAVEACEEFLAVHPVERMLRAAGDAALEERERESLLDTLEGLLRNEHVFGALLLSTDTSRAKALLTCGEEEVVARVAMALNAHCDLLCETLMQSLSGDAVTAENLLFALLFLASDEQTACFTAVMGLFGRVAALHPTALALPLFVIKVREMLSQPNLLVQIRAVEIVLRTAAISSPLAVFYTEERFYDACLEVYTRARDDLLARLSLVEVMKQGCNVPAFLAVLETRGVEKEFLAELQSPATELSLRRDLAVLCISLHKARRCPTTQPLTPFAAMANTFLKAEGEAFTAGVELLLHLFEFVEVLREAAHSAEPRQFLLLERKRDYEQRKLRELKAETLAGAKWSLAEGRRAELGPELFEAYFRLFYGAEALPTHRCVDGLVEGLRAPSEDTEELNLRVLRALVGYPTLFAYLLAAERVDELVEYLARRPGANARVLQLKAEVRHGILDRIDELAECDALVQRMLESLACCSSACFATCTAAE